jgi:hypothetical protein
MAFNAVPPEPNTAPIPRGTVRRFHVTIPANIPEIRREGLVIRRARGVEGPRAIYSWPTYREAENYGVDSPIVEFWMPADAYKDNPYATYAETPPDQIIGIHEEWHKIYKFALEDKLTPDELREVGFTDYLKAADALEEYDPDIRSNPMEKNPKLIEGATLIPVQDLKEGMRYINKGRFWATARRVEVIFSEKHNGRMMVEVVTFAQFGGRIHRAYYKVGELINVSNKSLLKAGIERARAAGDHEAAALLQAELESLT